MITKQYAPVASPLLHSRLQGTHYQVPSDPEFAALLTTTWKKGGDDTFGDFPEHLRALVSHALPNITVKAVTYPKFETRGDLAECVGRFTEWYDLCNVDLSSTT